MAICSSTRDWIPGRRRRAGKARLLALKGRRCATTRPLDPIHGTLPSPMYNDKPGGRLFFVEHRVLAASISRQEAHQRGCYLNRNMDDLIGADGFPIRVAEPVPDGCICALLTLFLGINTGSCSALEVRSRSSLAESSERTISGPNFSFVAPSFPGTLIVNTIKVAASHRIRFG